MNEKFEDFKSTQTYKQLAIEEIENCIEDAKMTPVPPSLWGKEIYWDIQYGWAEGETICQTGAIGKNEDDVNHPSHYCNRDMETIDIIEMIISIEKNPKVSYNMSNVLKYLLRFRDKGQDTKDLEKARWYLNRMIEHVNKEPRKT